MRRMTRWAGVVAMGWLSCMAMGLPTSRPAGVAPTTFFDETFPDGNGCMDRFKLFPVAPGKESQLGYDKERGGYGVGGHMALVRPVQASPRAILVLDIEFEPLAKDAQEPAETEFGFVNLNRSVVNMKVIRSVNDGKPQAKLQFWSQTQGQPEAKMLREIPLAESPAAAKWELEYRHGMVVLREGDRVLGRADTNTLGIPVAGVTWTQRGGRLICKRMTLSGAPPEALSEEQAATLRQAAGLNREAQALYRRKQWEEALAKMRESSALYVKIHGERHHDSGNSLLNLATILRDKGDKDEAAGLFKKALDIHEETLGPDHPHTAMTRFEVGRSLLESGDGQGARAMWTLCRDAWKDAYGPDWPLVRTLDEKLK
ncbi:MAG: tetratricopeptide repeat protein [Tepidisphaerales bacterium]